MTEVACVQRSAEWRELRECVLLTASQFADAAGLGRGKPADFLSSLVCGEEQQDTAGGTGVGVPSVDTPDRNQQHGIVMEPVIREAYELLTGTTIHDSGFWIPNKGHDMFNMIGATPDGKVMERRPDGLACVGLVEFKAPIYQLTPKNADPRTGVPRCHMAQMQGQLAVCKKPWCDYMAVCVSTRELTLKRVYFSPAYWNALAQRLKVFCRALQDCRRLKSESKLYTVRWSEKLPTFNNTILSEKDIKVVDLIERNANKDYRYKFRDDKKKMWMSFNFLVGSAH